MMYDFLRTPDSIEKRRGVVEYAVMDKTTKRREGYPKDPDTNRFDATHCSWMQRKS